ncbi:Nucleoside-diphosphate-sugar epimerase [Brevibacterium sp. 239c]|uniref:NAD-dependent epimerase/dehydratase family protein n=1 Tax=Brevibacterium sp. 239c TaxID=1965356 RepID=UPI000C527F84|nr:NAD-dependent epimerase/dehydratase family protein [Brevibacterium sp. 239c]SMY04523.1 Nucleoside-diphosphate-sugar epimerase [Brevibacterium sp. 239c]
MQILILGGSGQLGRQLVHLFVDAGHDVTCLARGTQAVPESAVFVRADRDRTDGLREVAGRQWDAVVDLATQPGHVRSAVVELWAQHWIYVSSLNVYQRGDVCEQDEDSPIHEPLAADTLSAMQDYGSAKVACEDAVRAGNESCTIIRAGLIAGDGDDTGRSGYYPWRFAHPTGDDVLVPDDLEFPIAMIDVKDLAAWMVHCAEECIIGTFNATGPRLTLGEAIQVSRRTADSHIPARPVVGTVLARANVSPWMGGDSLPWWLPDPAMRYAATADTRRARQCGLTLKPLEKTLLDALVYEESRGGPVGAGLSDETERRVREAVVVGD